MISQGIYVIIRTVDCQPDNNISLLSIYRPNIFEELFAKTLIGKFDIERHKNGKYNDKLAIVAVVDDRVICWGSPLEMINFIKLYERSNRK